MNTKKILIVVHSLSVSNGVTNFLMNYMLNMPKNGIQFDFLQTDESDSPYVQIVRNRGCEVYSTPDLKAKWSRNIHNFFKTLFVQQKYDAIHVNISDYAATLILLYAWGYGIPIRIFHSHNTKRVEKSLKSKIFCVVYDMACVNLSNKLLACTERAGKEIFGQRDFTVIKNAICLNDFTYNESMRRELREEFGISNEFVLGTVCRQAAQKNPYFIVDIFCALKFMKKDAKLLWIGTGPLFNEISEYIEKKGIKNDVLMVGNQNNMASWYSMMDVFVLPSLYEGLGIVYIEAQANGLPTFASDCVPKDSNVTELIKYIPLQKNAQEWATEICNAPGRNELNTQDMIRNAGYGISMEDNALLKYYYRIF